MADVTDPDGAECLTGQPIAVMFGHFKPASLTGKLMFDHEPGTQSKHKSDNGYRHRTTNRIRRNTEHDTGLIQRGNVDTIVANTVTEEREKLVITGETLLRPPCQSTGNDQVTAFNLLRSNVRQKLWKDIEINPGHLLNRVPAGSG